MYAYIVISNEKNYFSVFYDYGLIASYIYFRVTVLVKSHVYRFIEFNCYKVIFKEIRCL